MGNEFPLYRPEFRDDAVRLAKSSGKPVAAIARDLGVSYETLRKWIRQAAFDAGERQDGLTSEEREELRRLRRENRILQEEREILKKAAALFAQETDSRQQRRSSLESARR